MKELRCLTDVIKDNLAVQIDISDAQSWDLNTGFTVTSTTKWDGAKSDSIDLPDFGLTGFDNGRFNELYTGTSLTSDDTKLTLHRVGFNDATGGTFFTGLGLSAVTTASTVGNYYDLTGGYLQDFFKLDDYNYEILPARYNNGITIEMPLLIGNTSFNNEGFFLYLGARAEDKYQPSFSGETNKVDIITTVRVPASSLTVFATVNVDIITTGFSGVTTSLDNNLHEYISVEKQRNSIIDQDNPTEFVFEDVGSGDTWNNGIGFHFTLAGEIGYKYIDGKGQIVSDHSTQAITGTGWTYITLVYRPYDIIEDPDMLECADRRLGTLTFYKNGRKFWQIKEFPEFFFTGFKNDKETHIGVPYNISWGGASFGLKNSWHYDNNQRVLFDEQSQAYIDANFNEEQDPTIDFTCVPTSYTKTLSVLKQDIDDFFDPCSGATGTTIQRGVIEVKFTGDTGGTVGSQYFIQYDSVTTGITGAPEITLLSNRIYTFEFEVFDTGLFAAPGGGGIAPSSIGLVFSGSPFIELVEASPFGFPSENTMSRSNFWSPVKYRIKLTDNAPPQEITVGIQIMSEAPLNLDSILYIDKLTFTGQDGRSQDDRKQNLLIEQTFDKPFIGGIQKLKVYDRALNLTETLHNAKIESTNYGFTVKKGGRTIVK